MPTPYRKPFAIRFIGIASVFYVVLDVFPAIVNPLFALANGQYRPALEELGRVPMIILLLAGGLGLLHDKSWSRFVYWVLPAYSMIVTLVLLPRLLRAVPRGGDFWAVLNATSLYWPIATGILYLFAFIVSDHFWKLEHANAPLRAPAPPGRAERLR